MRYTTREQWHVTLRFLGDADIGEASAALQRVDAAVGRGRVGAKRRTARPQRRHGALRRPRRHRRRGALAPPPTSSTRSDDARPFVGHLTIARMKNARRCPATGFAIAASFAVTEVHLVRSHLSRDGARYEIVASRSLSSVIYPLQANKRHAAPRPPRPADATRPMRNNAAEQGLVWLSVAHAARLYSG